MKLPNPTCARLVFAVLLGFSRISTAAPTDAETAAAIGDTPALNLDDTRSVDSIIGQLAEKRVVYVGEIHTRYDHHLIQLHIIRALAARGGPLAIGVEWFQQPFQNIVDQYIAGDIDEQELLRQSEYFNRWKYDFRLYAPILRYARAHRIPVIALNLPTEVTRAVGERGLNALSPELRQWLPDTLDRSNVRYEARLREMYAAHPQSESGDFARFYSVQLLWDEGMAQRAAEYLRAHPGRRMVILTGSGHLAYGDGIPARVQRETGATSAIVLSQWQAQLSPDAADFLLLPQPRQLPPAGMLGVTIEVMRGGGVRLRDVGKSSAAARAGARDGDRLLAIDGEPVADLADVRTAMWEKMPGDQITVTVRRASGDAGDRAPKTLRATLQ